MRETGGLAISVALSGAVSGWNGMPEANSFLYTCQPFGNIA
jgi:hypothetical protein